MNNRTSLLTLLLALSLPLGAQDVYTDHPCVDLGLSVKWASYNVGAEAPEQVGERFAWGETETKETFTRENYRFFAAEKYEGDLRWVPVKYCDDPKNSFKKFTDGRKFLEGADDAATVRWGESWRMPSAEEWKELQDNCNWFWTTQNGQTGYLVTSLVNGNSIFLPASATKDELDHYTRYWSADVSSNWAAKSIDLNPALVTITSSPAKQFGQSVRAVLDGEKHEVVLPAGCYNYADYYRLKGDRLSTPPRPEAQPIRGTIRNERPAVKLDMGKDGTVGGHDFVDLGLSVRWATTNLGAAKADDRGDFYAWGETQTKTAVGKVENYKLATKVTVTAVFIQTGEESTSTKYVVNKYNDDSIREKSNEYWERTESPLVPIRAGRTLEAVDDAATAQWGKDWRMPSAREVAELYTNCMWIAVQQDGLNGFLVQSRVNGNSIFLPFTGVEGVFDITNPLKGRDRNVCHLWSRNRNDRNIEEALALYVTPESIIRQSPKDGLDSYPRWEQYAIRPVTSAVAKSTPKRKAVTTAASTPVHSKVNSTVVQWKKESAEAKKEREEKAAAALAARAALSGPVAGTVGGHDYVDLGLDVCWATCNIGAEDVLEYGTVFAWAETTSRLDTKARDELSQYRNYTLGNYKYYNGKSYTKYVLRYGGDGLRFLLPEDDAATQNWGEGWRTPSFDDFDQLVKNTDLIILKDGLKYYAKFTSRINGNSIIIPFWHLEWGYTDQVRANGFMNSTSLWTSNADAIGSGNAKGVTIDRGDSVENGWVGEVRDANLNRYKCFAIRPVIKVTNK